MGCESFSLGRFSGDTRTTIRARSEICRRLPNCARASIPRPKAWPQTRTPDRQRLRPYQGSSSRAVCLAHRAPRGNHTAFTAPKPADHSGPLPPLPVTPPLIENLSQHQERYFPIQITIDLRTHSTPFASLQVAINAFAVSRFRLLGAFLAELPVIRKLKSWPVASPRNRK